MQCPKRCGPLELTHRGGFFVGTNEWMREYACRVCGERWDAPGEPSWEGIAHPRAHDLLELADTTKRAHAAVLVAGNDAARMAEVLPMIALAVDDRAIGYLPVFVPTTPTILHVYAVPEDGWLADVAQSIVVRAGGLVIAQRGMALGNVLDTTITAVVRAARKEPLPCAVLGDADAADTWDKLCGPPSLLLDWQPAHVVQALEHIGAKIAPVRRAKRWSPPD